MSGWEQCGRRGFRLGHIYVAGEISNMRRIKTFVFFSNRTKFIQTYNYIDGHLRIFNFLLRPSTVVITVSSSIQGVEVKVAWEGRG